MTPKKDENSSMFKKIFSEARSKNEETLEETALGIVPPEVKTTDTNEQRKPGRPRGRRSNPDYTKICALIPEELLLEVQMILIQKRKNKVEKRPKDFSALIEHLLSEWAAENKED